MKAGIITFHFPYNCGAILQCLALQTALESYGLEAYVIDYRPWYHQNRYTPLKNPVYFAKKCLRKRGSEDTKKQRILRSLKGFLRSVYAWRRYPKLVERDRKFKNFRSKFLNESRLYRSIDKLRSNPPDYDIYISGSDQLWNAKITEGEFDPAYFMDFGSSGVGRITYSVGADFSVVKFPQSKLIKYLGRIQAISLREEKCYNTIKLACDYINEPNKQIHIDLDPTFLLEAEQYDRFMSLDVQEEEPYILTYTMPNLESQKTALQTAKDFASKTGLRVIDISGNPNATNQMIDDNRLCGPDEFLRYVKNADYILTNSFHGTVFSVIFKKRFVSIPHSGTGNRVTELLNKLGLDDRWQTSVEEALTAIQRDFSFEVCEKNLDELRRESKQYLEDCIGQFARKN